MTCTANKLQWHGLEHRAKVLGHSQINHSRDVSLSDVGCLLLELRTHRSNHFVEVLGVAARPGDVHGHLEGGFHSDHRGVVIDFLHQDRQVLTQENNVAGVLAVICPIARSCVISLNLMVGRTTTTVSKTASYGKENVCCVSLLVKPRGTLRTRFSRDRTVW